MATGRVQNVGYLF